MASSKSIKVFPIDTLPTASNKHGFSFSNAHSASHTNKKDTFIQKVFSVRVLLVCAFVFQVVFLAALFLGITSISQKAISIDLSHKIMDNVVTRIVQIAESTFFVPWYSSQGALFQLPSESEDLIYDKLQPALWKLWQQSLGYLTDIYLCDVAQGNCFGYCVACTDSGTLQEIVVNKTVSPDGYFAPVVDFKRGHGNFSDLATLSVYPNYTVQLDPWWLSVIEKKHLLWSDVYYDTAFPEITFFTLANPIVDAVTNETLAVLGVDVTSASLLDYLKNLDISEHAIVWILQPSGVLVACSSVEQKTSTNADGLNLAQESNLGLVRETTIRLMAIKELQDTSVTFSFDLHGSTIVAHASGISSYSLDLLLVVAYPQSDFLGAVQRIENTIIIASACALVFSVAIGVVVIYLIISPLLKLRRQMDEISSGSFESSKLTTPSQKTRLFEINALQRDFYRMVNALQSFGRFVPIDIVRYLLRNNIEARAEVTQKELTIMFSDIKNFTQKVEEMSPAQLSILLSDYLNTMCAVIGDNSGTVDKFIGDAIMALWNVPTAVTNHPMLACKAALQSIQNLRELNRKWHAIQLPEVECRIGIHTGKALVGNLGSKERLAYTAVGDNVNLASRLEGLNKKYGTSILITGEVHAKVSYAFLCRYLDVVVVQGRTTHTHIYELVASMEDATQRQLDLCRIQAEALGCFLSKNFQTAHNLYSQLALEYPNDIAIRLLLDRTSHALANSGILKTKFSKKYIHLIMMKDTLTQSWRGYNRLEDK